MAFYLEKALFVNRAPFEHLELDFKENGINILSAINGKGKTTILSYIVDAFHEIAKIGFENSYKNIEDQLYRVSSSNFNMDKQTYSLVLLKFTYQDKTIDYLDIRGNLSEAQYNELPISHKNIPYQTIFNNLDNQNFCRMLSKNLDDKVSKDIFNNTILTYFPAYRYEQPGYLNKPYQVKLKFDIESRYSGYLKNPIEVITSLPEIANWLLDVVLDEKMNPNNQKAGELDRNINSVVKSIMSSKLGYNINLGLGERNSGATRLSILGPNKKKLYPSIFNISSGEAALLCVFGELLRQSDCIGKDKKVSGIVLIDEIDKHLHIKLQREVLPKLFKLFPNIQFIVSSHSPFLNMGLADESMERTQIIDLDNMGLVCEPTNNDLFKEVYEIMINENQRFADKYNNLIEQIKNNSKPIIITEGKTDYKHIKKAIEILEKKDIDVDFYQVPEKWGSSDLKGMLESLSRIKQHRIIIGIFDRDEPSILSYLNTEHQQYKTYGDSNVYAFAIPLVNEKIYGNYISIEHYYNRNNLLKEDPIYHRRLFLGDEFHPSGNSKDGEFQTKTSNIKHKVEINGVIDEKVYRSTDLEQLHSIALSKDAFVTLIETNNEYTNDFNFNNFIHIINILQDIIQLPLK